MPHLYLLRAIEAPDSTLNLSWLASSLANNHPLVRVVPCKHFQKRRLENVSVVVGEEVPGMANRFEYMAAIQVAFDFFPTRKMERRKRRRRRGEKSHLLASLTTFCLEIAESCV